MFRIRVGAINVCDSAPGPSPLKLFCVLRFRLRVSHTDTGDRFYFYLKCSLCSRTKSKCGTPVVSTILYLLVLVNFGAGRGEGKGRDCKLVALLESSGAKIPSTPEPGNKFAIRFDIFIMSKAAPHEIPKDGVYKIIN
jgi:hypothetical protein